MALAAALGHDTFALVGHDWGGLVAWHSASRFTQVSCLVVIKAPTRAAWRPTHCAILAIPYERLRLSAAGMPEWVLRANVFQFLRRSLTESSRTGPFPEPSLQHYVRAWSHDRALTSMLNWYRALPSFGKASRKRIGAPTLVISGDLDDALILGLAEEISAYSNEGAVLHSPNASHWVHHEEAALVNAELLRFTRRTFAQQTRC